MKLAFSKRYLTAMLRSFPLRSLLELIGAFAPTRQRRPGIISPTIQSTRVLCVVLAYLIGLRVAKQKQEARSLRRILLKMRVFAKN